MLHKIPTITLLVLGVSLPLLAGCAGFPMNTAEPLFQKKYGDFDYCKLKAVKQARETSCGSACLASVMNYWGVRISEEDLLAKLPELGEHGLSIKDLKLIAIACGLDAYAFSMSDDPEGQLRAQILSGRPVICATRFPRGWYFAYGVPLYGSIYRSLVWAFGSRKSHYIVVFGIKDDEFLIMDPVRGFATLSRTRLLDAWHQQKYAALLCGRKKSPP